MPNWCENNLTVKGSKHNMLKFFKIGVNKDIPTTFDDEFIRFINNSKSSLSAFYPRPKTFDVDTTNYPEKFKKSAEYQLKKYGVVGWYDWCCQYYGTKWDSDFEFGKVNIEDNNIEIDTWFETAWSPPIAWLEKVQQDFPKLYFRMYYEEPGYAFCGVAETVFDINGDGTIELTELPWSESEYEKNPDNHEDDEDYEEEEREAHMPAEEDTH